MFNKWRTGIRRLGSLQPVRRPFVFEIGAWHFFNDREQRHGACLGWPRHPFHPGNLVSRYYRWSSRQSYSSTQSALSCGLSSRAALSFSPTRRPPQKCFQGRPLSPRKDEPPTCAGGSTGPIPRSVGPAPSHVCSVFYELGQGCGLGRCRRILRLGRRILDMSRPLTSPALHLSSRPWKLREQFIDHRWRWRYLAASPLWSPSTTPIHTSGERPTPNPAINPRIRPKSGRERQSNLSLTT